MRRKKYSHLHLIDRGLDQMIQHVLQLVLGRELQLLRPVAAGQAVGVPLLLVHIRVDPLRVVEHHVIVQRAAAGRRHLEDLGGAGGGDHGIGRGDGGDDVLDHALREAVGDALDAVLRAPLHRLLVDPGDVGGVVAVDGGHVVAEGLLLGPEEEAGVLDAVLG